MFSLLHQECRWLVRKLEHYRHEGVTLLSAGAALTALSSLDEKYPTETHPSTSSAEHKFGNNDEGPSVVVGPPEKDPADVASNQEDQGDGFSRAVAP